MDIDEKNLRCLRIEMNSYTSVFLYYKQYPKKDSKRFPQSHTVIMYYFDKTLEDKFFYLYMSLIGQIDNVQLGSYVNKKGSKATRRIVNFALVKFIDEESMGLLLHQQESQRLINEFIVNRKNRKINLSYDPMKDENNDQVEDDAKSEEERSVDEEGFFKVKKNTAKSKFSKGELSFKIKKENVEEEEELGIKKKDRKNKNDFYWNFQLLDKKREIYDELKKLFEEDKKAIDNKKRKLK